MLVLFNQNIFHLGSKSVILEVFITQIENSPNNKI